MNRCSANENRSVADCNQCSDGRVHRQQAQRTGLYISLQSMATYHFCIVSQHETLTQWKLSANVYDKFENTLSHLRTDVLRSPATQKQIQQLSTGISLFAKPCFYQFPDFNLYLRSLFLSMFFRCVKHLPRKKFLGPLPNPHSFSLACDQGKCDRAMNQTHIQELSSQTPQP